MTIFRTWPLMFEDEELVEKTEPIWMFAPSRAAALPSTLSAFCASWRSSSASACDSWMAAPRDPTSGFMRPAIILTGRGASLKRASKPVVSADYCFFFLSPPKMLASGFSKRIGAAGDRNGDARFSTIRPWGRVVGAHASDASANEIQGINPRCDVCVVDVCKETSKQGVRIERKPLSLSY